MKYIPKTGAYAGQRNKERIKDYFKKYPNATGVDAARDLKLSLPTVYNHLKNIRNGI